MCVWIEASIFSLRTLPRKGSNRAVAGAAAEAGLGGIPGCALLKDLLRF